MMKMFLVRATIKEYRYMRDTPGESEEFRIVMAEDEYDAREKYCNYWESKNSPYDVSYHVETIRVTETIE